MNEKRIYQVISEELGLGSTQVQASVQLLAEGNTIPFIARYRKERTGELDEAQLRSIEERYRYLKQLQERKEEVIRLIEEQGKLTEELKSRIEQAIKLQEVEDLYRPFRPKRKTRASVAREKGLAPLAELMMASRDEAEVEEAALRFVSEEKGVTSPEEALAGARDIVAETIADDPDIRQYVRELFWKKGVLVSAARDPEKKTVYEMYYEYSEAVRRIPSHRILAVNRGEREEVLRVRIEVEEEEILRRIWARFPHPGQCHLKEAVADGYKRLLAPSVEREIRGMMTEKAEEQAIRIFAENLRNLLLTPPVSGQRVLGIDPAYRTGCKLAVVDDTGKLLHTDVVFPTPPENRVAEAKRITRRIIEKYRVDLIALGNGTASRETEAFVAELIGELDRECYYVIVNEAGASVYSASKTAREEFPQLDAASRSAISIARRLQDPLAEMVKIVPKAVGVGQYQHDVSQKRLTKSLTAVVESVVNHVGVDVNTASPALLGYVSGITSAVAKNIVHRREEAGRFKNREELKEIPRLGAKTYEQCIGFLRILDEDHPLDKTPIHPESYPVVERLLTELEGGPEAIGTEKLNKQLRRVDVPSMAERIGCGIPTLRDIIDALLKPGRDPRTELPPPILRSDVLMPEDLRPGMQLKGTVRNVVDFGAFVDIGLKNDGLVHISRMSEQFVYHPLDVVSVGDIVDVWVFGVDLERERVSLSMVPVSPGEGE